MSVTDNLSFVLNRRPNLKFNCKLLFYLFISFKILIPNFPVSSSIMECQLNDPNITIPMLLSKIISMIPTQHFVIACAVLIFIVLYNFLEFHLIGDALKGFRGDRVRLTFNSSSEIYEGVASRCRSLHGRYLVTPWLSSPHFQTTFLNFFGRPPSFHYSRQLYKVQDGGTIALDWLLASNAEGGSYDASRVISKEDKTPLVIVVPGLTSDSVSPYLKHLVYGMAKQGWNVVVSNHRGLGGISITSDRFYNAGWTDDVREVINYLHKEYPEAPLFAVGTSIGANILVKYLGEEGENTPLAGAASICSPWDLVVCDRFINRKLVQRLYDRALAFGLKGYAQLHQAILTRLANWDGISSSRTVRDFDNHATCIVAKFETVDTYYRHCSSVSFVSGVSVPLLCISAIDDPVCTSEAIPWDECRANKKIVLATLPHGGHLAFFQGITARKLWWVGAVGEFLAALYTSPYMHGQQQIENTGVHYSIESDIDKSPYVNLMDDGLVTALITDTSNNNGATSINTQTTRDPKPGTSIIDQNVSGNNEDNAMTQVQTTHEDRISKIFSDMTSQVKRSMNRVSRQSGISVWLLAYVAIVTSWPLLGSFLGFFKRKKLLGVAKAAAFSR